ncbi:MAG: hypothetical protein AB7U82_25330 [Blastocatellales bacterium]
MSKFSFETDRQAEEFCTEIAKMMVKLFGITEIEAVGRINRQWQGQKIVGPNRMIYHEDTEFWAKTIYYGADVHWWRGEEGLEPQPFP